MAEKKAGKRAKWSKIPKALRGGLEAAAKKAGGNPFKGKIGKKPKIADPVKLAGWLKGKGE